MPPPLQTPGLAGIAFNPWQGYRPYGPVERNRNPVVTPSPVVGTQPTTNPRSTPGKGQAAVAGGAAVSPSGPNQPFGSNWQLGMHGGSGRPFGPSVGPSTLMGGDLGSWRKGQDGNVKHDTAFMNNDQKSNWAAAIGGKGFTERDGKGSADFYAPDPNNPGGVRMTGSVTPDANDPNKRVLTSRYGTGSVTQIPNKATDPLGYNKWLASRSFTDTDAAGNKITTTGADAFGQQLRPMVARQQQEAKDQIVAGVDKANPGYLNKDTKTLPGAVPGDTAYDSMVDPNRDVGLDRSRGTWVTPQQQAHVAELGRLNLPKFTPAPAAAVQAQRDSIANLGKVTESMLPNAEPRKPGEFNPLINPFINKSAASQWNDPNSMLNVGKPSPYAQAPAAKPVPESPAISAGLKAFNDVKLPSGAPPPQFKSQSDEDFAEVRPTVSKAQIVQPPQNWKPFGTTRVGGIPAVPAITPKVQQLVDYGTAYAGHLANRANNWLNSTITGTPSQPAQNWVAPLEQKWTGIARGMNEQFGRVKDERYVPYTPNTGSNVKGAALHFALQCAKFANAITHAPTGLKSITA